MAEAGNTVSGHVEAPVGHLEKLTALSLSDNVPCIGRVEHASSHDPDIPLSWDKGLKLLSKSILKSISDTLTDSISCRIAKMGEVNGRWRERFSQSGGSGCQNMSSQEVASKQTYK